MKQDQLDELTRLLARFVQAQADLNTAQRIADMGYDAPGSNEYLKDAEALVQSLEPGVNAAKQALKEGLKSGVLAMQGQKIVLAENFVPEGAGAVAPLAQSVRGTETLAAKNAVDPAELEASTARAKAEAERVAAAEREAVAKSVAEDEARRKAELERLAAVPAEPAAPKPVRDPLSQAVAKADAPELPKSDKAFGIAGGFVRPAEAPTSGGAPSARTPPDVTRIEEALGRKADDQVEYLKLREELVKKFGVERIEDIPQTPEAEKVIGEFVGTAAQPRNKGRFGSAPKSAATGTETPPGGSFEPVPAGRKGVMEAGADDSQMKARRDLQAVNFKKEARALPRGAQDALIEKWLGGPAALTFARNNSGAVRDKMVEVALLRDRVDADIGETNRLDDWKKRVDEQADIMRGRGRAAATGRGSVKPTAFDNLRGQAMNTQGSLKNEMLNLRITPKDAALEKKITEANAPRSGTMSATGAALGGTAAPAPVASGSTASMPAGTVTAGSSFTPAMGERAAAPASAAPTGPAPSPAAPAPASAPVGGGGVPTGGSFTPLGAAPSAPASAVPAAAPTPGTAASAAPFKFDRNWRAQPISPRQKAVLIKSGIDEAKLPKTFGEASDLMDEIGTKTGKFVPLTDAQKKALLEAGMPEADLPKSKFAASQDLGEIKKAASGAVPAGGSFTPVADGSASAAEGAKDAWRAEPISPRQASSLKKGVKAGLITQEQADAITNRGDASAAIKFLKQGKRVPETKGKRVSKAVSTGAKAAATAATPATSPATGAPAGAAPATAPATAPASAGAGAAAATGAAPAAPAAAASGTRPSAAAVRGRAQRIFGKGVGSKLGGLGRFLGPLAAIYGGYQILDLLKQGTLDAADERRLKMMQALGAVGGGAQQEQMMNDQMRQMRFMADMTAIQNQQGRMQSRNQSISDQALSSLLRGHESSLQALALPSQPSVAEVMARM